MHIRPILIPFAALTLATPLPASLAPRAHPCQNAPNTIAGSPPPNPRSHPQPIHWCIPSTPTYITLLPISFPGPGLDNPAIHDMLDKAYSYIIGHLALEGDSLVPSGTFTWRAYGFSLQTWNANNHQTTWSVLQEGVGALRDYMARYGYGTVRFSIFDGANQVGAGVVE